MEQIQEEITALEKELATFQDELKVIQKSIIKGMDNGLFKQLMVEKAQVEKDISEIEIEIKMLKGLSLEEADAYFGNGNNEEVEEEVEEEVDEEVDEKTVEEQKEQETE